MFDKDKVRVFLSTLRNNRGWTLVELGNELNLSIAMASQVLKGKRDLSDKKIIEMCDKFSEPYESFYLEYQVNFDARDTLFDIQRIYGLDAIDIAEKTEIDFLDVAAIMEGKRAATEEEIKRIGEVFDTNIEIISKGKISANLSQVENLLSEISVSQKAIENILKYIEMDIRKPPL